MDAAVQNVQGAKETDLSLYLFELSSLPEETDALTYWNVSMPTFQSLVSAGYSLYVENQNNNNYN